MIIEKKGSIELHRGRLDRRIFNRRIFNRRIFNRRIDACILPRCQWKRPQIGGASQSIAGSLPTFWGILLH